MTTTIVSHLLIRRYVTELVRTPRPTAALGGKRRPAQPPAPRPAVTA